MKLNEKYSKTIERADKIIDSLPDEPEYLPTSVMCRLIFRQILELHQKIDGLPTTNQPKVVAHVAKTATTE